MNQGQGQDKREYTLDQDLESLLARNFDSDRIVDIMSSAGYDPNEVATQINQRYENQRKDLLSQKEELDRVNQEQKDLYEGLLKKKDSPSVQGGEPSRFGLAGSGQINNLTPDFMLSESAKAERELQDKQPSLEAVADPYVAQVNLMDLQGQAAYFNYNGAVVLSEQAQSYENQDPTKINKVLRYMQGQGLMTEFNIQEEPYEPEDLAKIAEASKKIASTATDQYNNVLETANKVNERSGVDFRYRPNSESDFNMFMSHSMERTLADEKKLEKEVQDEIDRVGEKAYYGTKTLGGAIKSDLYEAYEGTMSGFQMIMHDIGKSFPNDGPIHEELYREAVRRREESDERRRVTTKQLAVNVGVDDSVFEMGITDRIGAALSGEVSAADFWIASTAQTSRLMADAFRTAAEFTIGMGIPLATDVFSNQYAETRLNNPHMGAGEVALHAAPKAATEILMEKFMAGKGIGATGALRNIGRNIMGKEALKSSAKNVLGKKGGGFVGKYLLPEAFEEGIIGVTNQWIDMFGDYSMGRNVRDLNFTEVSDAFLGGFAGAVGPAGLASLSSNIGHSRNMKDRLKVMEVLKDARALHDQERNPKTKALYREKLVKAMADFEMITKEEMAFYGTLNPEEQGKVLGLNQELSRIKEILSQGKYWTGESVTKEDRATLEKRYEALMGSKTELEESALKRAEKESEEPVTSEDAGGQEVTSEPQEQSKEDSTKRKDTKEASDTAPKEEVEQMEMLFEYDESQDPTVDVESTATTDEDGDTVSTRVEVSEEYAAEQLKEDGIESPTAEQVEAKQAELMEEGRKAVAEEAPAAEEVSPTFDTEVDGETNFVQDTENVGDGKGQMGLRQAEAIDNLTKSFKRKGAVKKIKFYKNYEEMAQYSSEVAAEMKEGKVKAFFDPSNNTVVMHKGSNIKDIREEFGHANLVDIIGKDAPSRKKLYNELKTIAKTNESVKNILDKVDADYEGTDVIQEEAIVKVLREYAANPARFEGRMARFIKMLNSIAKKFGNKGNVITGKESIIKLARKFELAAQGVATDVAVEPLAEAETDVKAPEATKDPIKKSFSKKSEFTYLKDAELFYTDVTSRQNKFTGVSKVASTKEKSVKVNDYFHYRNLWAKLTGNGKEASRMQDVFFLKDGKKYNVRAPKPKTDRAGKPLSIPTQMSFVERKLQSHFKKETALSELLQQRSALMTEAGDVYSKNSKKLNFYTNMQDFSPTETEDIPTRETVESVSSDIEDHIIAKKNMLALIASDITAEDLKAIAGRSGHISKESNPELFNMSGVKKFNVIDVDGEIQDPSDTNRDVNPDATSGIRFSKDKGKVYRQNILDKKRGSIEVKKYLGKSSALKSKPWAEVAKGFKEGKTFNVAWDQVAAADFTFSGNPKTYKTRSGVDEVTSSDWGKSVSFRSHNLRKSFANKVKDLSGEVNVSISLNGANEMVANPLVFEAVVDNIFHQVREGVIDPEVVLKQANIGFNGRKSANKPSVFEAILESEDSYQFNDLVVKVSDGVYEWKDYKSFEEGHKLFLKANNTTMGHFKTVGKALTRNNFTADAQIKGDPILPTMSDLREMLILPQYLSQTGKPVESGTIAAVMTIDLDKMRGVSGGIQTRMDEGSAFPYAFNGGLESIVTISDQPRTEDVFRVSTPNKARTGTDTVKATAAEVGRGVKTVTSKGIDSVNEDVKFSKEGGIDTVGGMKNTETDQGEFELREMSAFQRARNRFLQKLANKYQYLFNLQEDVSKSRAQKLSEDQDFEMAETLMYGKAANDLEKLEGSIKEITENLRKEGLSVEEVEQYLYALHVKERNAVILERSLGEDTEGSGISDERSDEILNSISDKTKEKLDPIVKKIREVQQNTRDTMVEFGLESQETIDVLEGLFKNYVPLGGLATDEQDSFDTSYPTGGAGMHVYGSTMKKAAGRKSEAPDILAQIVAQNAAVHIKARTNEALQTLYELVKNNPNKNVWSIVNRPNDGDAHSVAVRIEGKQKYIRFKDASYAETVRGLNAPASSRFTKLLKAPSSWLRASFTTLNPEFMISNFSRDIQSAVFNAAAETEIEGGRLDGAEVVKDMIKVVPETLKALLKPRVGLKADPLIERYYEEYKADGGKTGWAYTEKIADIAQGLVKDSKDKSKLQRMLGTPRNMADFVEGINDAFENSIRLASYISARENGVSRSKSAQFAKNVTVNFNRNGEWGQALNGVYLFFNASVQGSMVIGRALGTLKPPTKPDGSTRKAYERVNNAQKLAFGLFLFSGLVTMMNRAMSDEDEDGVIFYDKIPDYIKERNIIVMNPRNGRDYYKIPLPYGYSLFSSLGSTAVDVSAGAKDWDEAILFLSSSTINAFSPISFGQSKDLFTHLGKSATPTVLKPIVDIMTNETYFGSPVYAAQSPYSVPKPESSMSFRSPKAMQEFFEWINEATGGSKQVSGGNDINPDKLWYIFEYAIGGAGKFINRSGQLVTKLNAKVEDNDFKFDANDLPFARILYGNASKYYDSGKYSENREVVTQLSKELADNRRIGDPLRYRGILVLKERLKTYEKQLKVIRAQERSARDFEDFTKRSIRIQELRDKKNRIFMQFNRAYENLRKQ